MWKLMRRADEGKAQEGRTREVAHHGEVMMKEDGVVDQPFPAMMSSVKLLGLSRTRWRCGSASTALIEVTEMSGISSPGISSSVTTTRSSHSPGNTFPRRHEPAGS